MPDLTLRLVKGAPLTNAEVDNNFIALNTGINDIVDGTTPLQNPTLTGDVTIDSTSAVKMPVGTTAERPATPVIGQIRYNSESNSFEGYINGAWSPVGAGGGITGAIIENDNTITADYTITAGKNAGTFGPVTIDPSVTVTVPNGSVWTIV